MPSGHNGSLGNSAWLWTLAVLLVIFFVWGAEQVAVMPLQTGEIYQPYSTLRADPLGAKALYESLAALSELNVSRLYKQRSALERDTALLVLGVDAPGFSEVSEDVLTGYERLLQRGGRLVIAFVPARGPGSQLKEKPDLLKQNWNVHLAYRQRGNKIDPQGTSIPRQSSLYFQTGPPWKVLSEIDGFAQEIERPLGAGTVVLLADSYPLSNEGLRESRDAASIVRLIGPARNIVFDENHFGVTESGSVAGLIRKYRLEGAVAILLAVVGLFIWHSASSFLPPRESPRDQGVTGRDSQEGLTALLRRSVPESELVSVCFREWSRMAPAARQAELVEAEIALWAGKDPVEAYRAASRKVTEKR